MLLGGLLGAEDETSLALEVLLWSQSQSERNVSFTGVENVVVRHGFKAFHGTALPINLDFVIQGILVWYPIMVIYECVGNREIQFVVGHGCIGACLFDVAIGLLFVRGWGCSGRRTAGGA